MPTDFSFVTPEGWEAMAPDFEKAEKKWLEKVKRKEIDQATADKIVRLMWDKYETWSKGKGLKHKEDQTVIQKHEAPTKTEKKAMVKEARIGRTQLIDILNAITDGTVDKPMVFAQTLELNRIVDSEFFDLFAKDVQTYPQLYPQQLINYFSGLFKDWGYGPEMEQVSDARRGASGPRVKPPTTYDRPAAKPEAPAAGPGAPGPEAGEGVQYPVEPQPWPQGMAPARSAKGNPYRWYVLFQMPGEQQQRAAVAEGVNREDMLAFIYAQQKAGLKIFQVKPISQAEGAAATPGPGQAQAPAKPGTPEGGEPAAQKGTIETPDSGDPQQYTWLMRYQTRTGHGSQSAPVMTGREVLSLMKRMEQMGVEILELRKLNIGQESSMDDVIIRVAQGDGEAEDKFKSGTPVIFIDDVNLEFDAISARGQIKKNMTGRVKKVDDQNYTIDIAGQIYRVPKIVADGVMEQFVADVVVSDKDLEEGGEAPAQGQPEGAAQAKPEVPEAAAAQAPAPESARTPAPVGGTPKTDLSRAPRPRAGAQEDEIVIAATVTASEEAPVGAAAMEELARGRFGKPLNELTFQEYHQLIQALTPEKKPPTYVMAAMMTNRQVAEAFVRRQPKGKSKHMFIDGGTVYSYGTHFPIATWADDDTVYFTNKSYSTTTSIHKSLVRQALHSSGANIVESSAVRGDEVGKPTAEDRKMQAKREQSEKKSQGRRLQKQQTRRPVEPVAEESYAPGPSESQTGKDPVPGMGPLMEKKHTVPAPRGEEPSFFNIEQEIETMKPGQREIVLNRLLDQYSTETDPEKKKQIEQQIRSVQAAIKAMMFRRADLIGIKDLEQEVADRTREKFRIKEEEVASDKLPINEPFSRQNTKPREAATKTEAFADLLMLIEREAPGVPSEIGRRLYRADGAVTPHTK